MAKECCLFLGAGHGNAKILVQLPIEAERHAREIGDHGGDVIFADDCACDFGRRCRRLFFGQELKRADAVMTDFGQKAEGIDAGRADMLRNPPPQHIRIRQQVFENGCNRSTNVASLSEWKR
jgi:hypothetical protein